RYFYNELSDKIYKNLKAGNVEIHPKVPESFILELFSDVVERLLKEENIESVSKEFEKSAQSKSKQESASLTPQQLKEEAKKKAAQYNSKDPVKVSLIEKIGRSMGGVVGIFYQAARETVEQVIKNI
ncbi:hypothetical protein ABK046_44425, partial [Streptomyces caeruleatus]